MPNPNHPTSNIPIYYTDLKAITPSDIEQAFGPQQPAPPTTFHGQILRRGKRRRRATHFYTHGHMANNVLNPDSANLEDYQQLIYGPNTKEWLRGNGK